MQDQPDVEAPDGGAGGGGGPSLPEMPSLPDNAAGRAVETLASIGEAFGDGVRQLGSRLAELLPQTIDIVAALL